ncbi:aspartic proteinase-like protein 1 isoform X1 [Cannabis sativa]|uniref:aspartic proteinase-like protein 1 isoform X1 n=1 Tax=Cannabis sativa TaxID=3483 RepID=UPI0029CA7D26|nr:aspartic proteinase-like protein 1 isoform X1 [Cannabis sativa]
MATRSLLLLAVVLPFVVAGAGNAAGIALSSKLIHRFSDEAKVFRVSGHRFASSWPQRSTVEYYEKLLASDFQRQKMKLGSQFQFLFPSEGSQTMSLGNYFGWLHYTWIDIGTPNVSFLVALDVGSDLLWVPCDCVQCAPLSSSYYSSLDRDLNEYTPSGSNTSKHLSCSHQLCELGPNCKNPKQPCPYVVNYGTENTSTSGLLVEDILHLAAWKNGTSNTNNSVQAPVIVGCGMKQSGSYLDGIAPDGLMGLGLGEISVPSFLAKAGIVRNSFSLCFDENDSGRIFFGDLGPINQHSTSFLPSPSNGNYDTYIVGVQAFCIGNSCIKETNFKALVDTGTSFTFLPEDVYEKVSLEFDKRVNATKTSFDGYPWKYCYRTSSQASVKIPSVTLVFPANNSFVVYDPVFPVNSNEGVIGFCLAIQQGDEIGIIGQNFMTGYRMVFDREALKLGWSRSNCQDLSDAKGMNLTPPPKGTPANPLPTNEQQSNPGDIAVAPAVAGRAPSKPSAASSRITQWRFYLLRLSLLLLQFHIVLDCLVGSCFF